MAFNTLEKKALFGLGILYASRMLGLFMVLPILVVYGQNLSQANTLWLGLALGIYGITQASLQIPFGMLSDRYGRKPLILLGLLIFLLGSLVAALSTHVWGLVVGRALQGAGAIASVVLALLADYTRDNQRTKAMAIIGAIIGASFILAVILGPWLASLIGLSGVFWFTSALALLGMVVVVWLPEAPPPQRNDRSIRSNQLVRVLQDWRLSTLSLAVFSVHLAMTALFVGFPLLLARQGVMNDQLGWVYAPLMLLSFLAMLPVMLWAERSRAYHRLFYVLGALIALALTGLNFSEALAFSLLCVWLFFVAFNVMEATLPSLVSRSAPLDARGTALGVFSTSQFLGAALGGVLGGWAFAKFGMTGIAILALTFILTWLMVLWWSQRHATTIRLDTAVLPLEQLENTQQVLQRNLGVYRVFFKVLPQAVRWEIVVNNQQFSAASLRSFLRTQLANH